MAQLADSAKHPPQLLWLNLPVVLSRQFAKLRLDKYAGPDAEADKDKRVKIEPDGPLPCLYHSLEAALCADGWMTETFAYDWRKHIENRGVAYALKNLILARGTTSRPVHIVTHSQGGVVSRAALAKLAQQVTPHHGKSLVGEVIMLGPANYGSFDVALTIANSTEQIPVAKLLHNPRRWVQRVLASFTAFYQLMPWDENLVRSLQDPNHDVPPGRVLAPTAPSARLTAIACTSPIRREPTHGAKRSTPPQVASTTTSPSSSGRNRSKKPPAEFNSSTAIWKSMIATALLTGMAGFRTSLRSFREPPPTAHDGQGTSAFPRR